MSSYREPKFQTYKAGEAFAASRQYTFVKADPAADDQVLKCGAGEKAIGIVMNLPTNTVGEELEIAGLGGGALLKMAAVLARGVDIASDANGEGVAAATTQWSPALVDEAVNAIGDVVAVELDGHYAP